LGILTFFELVGLHSSTFLHDVRLPTNDRANLAIFQCPVIIFLVIISCSAIM